ncbi:MAG: DUF454 domain-containing protein [Candidatus Omnitrophica bacterium]|nr:DUF454 domain-containing protein [Candidatus Omnitrophota bacterium]
MGPLHKLLLNILGWFFLCLGVVGLVLPLMPAVIFFILASVCFSRGSRRFHAMLVNNPWLGPHIRRYHAEGGLPAWVKFLLVAGQWAGLVLAFVLFVDDLRLRLVMAGVALTVTILILSLPTSNKTDPG